MIPNLLVGACRFWALRHVTCLSADAVHDPFLEASRKTLTLLVSRVDGTWRVDGHAELGRPRTLTYCWGRLQQDLDKLK